MLATSLEGARSHEVNAGGQRRQYANIFQTVGSNGVGGRPFIR